MCYIVNNTAEEAKKGKNMTDSPYQYICYPNFYGSQYLIGGGIFDTKPF